MSASPIVVRALVVADAASYRALRLRGLAEHPDAFTSDADEEARKPLDWIERRIGPKRDAPHDIVLGAFDVAGVLVGIVGMDVDPRRKVRHRGHVFGMYVPAERRGAGVGGQLLRALIERARSVPGLEALTLTVTAGNAPARSLYERAGFVAWGTDRAAIKVGAIAYDKVHMTKHLDTLSRSATEAR